MKKVLPNSNSKLTNETVQLRTPKLKIWQICLKDLSFEKMTKTNKFGDQNVVCG